MAGIYNADIFCDDCIEDIKNAIWQASGDHAEFDTREDWEEAKGFDDERAYDSDEYPKYCDDDEESDSPQHCGSHDDCLNPTTCPDGTVVSHCFGNSLTSYGEDYVKEAVRDGGSVAELWREVYYWIDFEE